jgi:hypothetical protein
LGDTYKIQLTKGHGDQAEQQKDRSQNHRHIEKSLLNSAAGAVDTGISTKGTAQPTTLTLHKHHNGQGNGNDNLRNHQKRFHQRHLFRKNLFKTPFTSENTTEIPKSCLSHAVYQASKFPPNCKQRQRIAGAVTGILKDP